MSTSLIVAIIIACGTGLCLWVVLLRRKINLLRRDPKAFHDWSIACVRASRASGARIPDVVIDYLAYDADLEWAAAIGLSSAEPEFQAIKTAQEAKITPLMRFQLFLEPSEKAFFEGQLAIRDARKSIFLKNLRKKF